MSRAVAAAVLASTLAMGAPCLAAGDAAEDGRSERAAAYDRATKELGAALKSGDGVRILYALLDGWEARGEMTIRVDPDPPSSRWGSDALVTKLAVALHSHGETLTTSMRRCMDLGSLDEALTIGRQARRIGLGYARLFPVARRLLATSTGLEGLAWMRAVAGALEP